MYSKSKNIIYVIDICCCEYFNKNNFTNNAIKTTFAVFWGLDC